MKKLLFALAFSTALMFLTFNASAQAFKNGDNLLNVGVGFAGSYSGTSIGASFEHGVTDAISVGVGADFLHYNFGGTSFNFTYLAVRGSYHFGELLNIQDKKFDPYAGLGLGYVTYGSFNVSSGVFLQAHVGARYFFSDNIGGFAEIGAGSSTIKLGVAFKF